MKGVRFGINIPQFHPSDAGALSALGKFAEHAESLGYESLWTLDGFFRDPPFLEPLTSLAYAAAVTRKVRLGTAVLLLPLRVPSVVAKEAATIDFLSSGRLVLGAALGGGDKEYSASGIPMGERVARFTEGLEIMRLLWTKPRVSYKGRFWSLSDAGISPRPSSPGGIPVLMGGSQMGEDVNDKAVQRAARLGDGWLAAGSTTIEASIRSFARFLQCAKDLGRDTSGLAVAKRVYIHVDPDRKRARSALDAALASFYGGPRNVEGICVFGPSHECAAKLRSLVEAGAHELILHPVVDQFEQAERLAREVIPEVR